MTCPMRINMYIFLYSLFYRKIMNYSTDSHHTISIDLDNANQRFDRFLRKFYKPYTTVTLTMIYSWIRKGYIRLNNKKWKEDTKVILWDTITIDISKTIPLSNKKVQQDTKNAEKELEMIQSHIVYEDKKRLVFNKPPHMLMHPWSGSAQKAITMNDWLYSYLNKQGQENWTRIITQGSTFKPAFCYRLDKDTSWVLIAAKEYDALQYLNELIRIRDVTKWYVVVVAWSLPKSLLIDKPLFKWFHWEKWRAHMFVNHEKWLPSKTMVYNLGTIQDRQLWTISLGLVRLFTGRMHQIRVHLVSEWFPVIWDQDYGNANIAKSLSKTHKIHRQLLHSFAYSFMDIDKSLKQFTAQMPNDIQKLFPKVSEDVIKEKIRTILSSK